MIFHYVTEQDKAQVSALSLLSWVSIDKDTRGQALLSGERSGWSRPGRMTGFLNDHSRQRAPIVADRLVSPLLARVVQADVLAGRGERSIGAGSARVFPALAQERLDILPYQYHLFL